MKNFKGLFWTQFLGAANDNFFKNSLVMLIAFKGLNVWGLDAKSVVALAGGIFILPYFLFSGIAGEVSEHFERSKVMRATKYAELLIMIGATLCFYLESYDVLLIVLFFMGTQSTFFSPPKYSSIIELCPGDDFIKANAYFEIGTFSAILIGTVFGGVAAGVGDPYLIVSCVILFMSILGILTSKKIPILPLYKQENEFSWNPFRPSWKVLKLAWRNYDIRYTTLLTSLFWFIGACLLSIIPSFTKEVLHGDETLATLILALFTIGIGIGSFVCEKISKGKVELAISGGSIFFVVYFLFDLSLIQYSTQTPDIRYTGLTYLSTGQSPRALIDFLLVSLALGMFAVPINTWLQQIAPDKDRSRVIAANNIINSVAMVLSAVFLISLHSFQVAGAGIFFCLSVFSLVCFLAIAIYYPVIIRRAWNFVLKRENN